MALTSILATNNSLLANILLANPPTSSISLSLTDALVFTEVIDNLNYDVFDTLTLTESIVAYYPFNQIVSDTLSFTETFTENEIRHLSVSDTLTITEVRHFKFKTPILDSLTYSETIVEELSKFVRDTLTFSETVSVVKTYVRSKSDIITFNESRVLRQANVYLVSDTLAYDETISRRPVKYASSSDSITYTDKVVRSSINRTVTDTVIYSESNSKSRIIVRSVSDSLLISETLVNHHTLNITTQDTFQFLSGYNRLINVGSAEYVFVPEIQVTKLTRKCLVILQGTELSMTLPCPEFSDSESNESQVKVLRFKNGGKRLYKQTDNKRKLNYNFVINRLKAYELKNFIDTYNNKPFKMINWKGEIWYCTFSNNPFTFTEVSRWEGSCGNKFTIPLDFEGVKLN